MKYPKINEQLDRRKRLTVRKMILDLIDYGFSYREMASIFGVSYSLFGKYKVGLKVESEKRNHYKKQKGTMEDRQYRRKIRGKEIVDYERYWHKKRNDKNRKNKFTPRRKESK